MKASCHYHRDDNHDGDVNHVIDASLHGSDDLFMPPIELFETNYRMLFSCSQLFSVVLTTVMIRTSFD